MASRQTTSCAKIGTGARDIGTSEDGDFEFQIMYLDTAVLVRQLDASLAKLMQPPLDAAREDVAARQQHIVTLEKLRPCACVKP